MISPIRIVRTNKRYVIDTTTLVSYFHSVFEDATPKISTSAISIIDQVFKEDSHYLMVIPSIVFVEIFDIWFRGETSVDEEFRAKFKAEVLRKIQSNPQIEIKEMDSEVMEAFLTLTDPIINLENRDRFVLAAAQTLDATLITSDRKIKKYFLKHRNIPALIT